MTPVGLLRHSMGRVARTSVSGHMSGNSKFQTPGPPLPPLLPWYVFVSMNVNLRCWVRKIILVIQEKSRRKEKVFAAYYLCR